MDKASKQIGQILVARGLLTEEQLADTLREQKVTKEFLGQILLKRKWISEDDFLQTLAEQFGVTYIRLKKEEIDLDLAWQFSATLLSEHKCFPIKQDEYTITVAINNPLDAWALSAVERESRLHRPKFVLVSERDMCWLLEQYRRYVDVKRRQMLG